MAGENEAEVLFAKLSAERKTGELLQLPEDFFEKASAAPGAREPDVQANNDKLLNTLKAKRIQKLLIYLAYDRPLPHPIPYEEEILYKEIKSLLDNGGASRKTRRIRVLADVPELVTPNGDKLGPYRRDEIIETSKESDAQFILKNKIGEIVG